MTTQNDLLLELRVSELETELIRLRRQLDRLSTPTATPAQQAKGSGPLAERTTIHQRVAYAFESKLPPIRRVVDFRSVNTNTGQTVCVDGYSVTQLTNALRKFARLQFISRRYWTGDKQLYSVCRRLFAQRGGIQKHPGTVKWVWAMWPADRATCAARIVAALSRQN